MTESNLTSKTLWFIESVWLDSNRGQFESNKFYGHGFFRKSAKGSEIEDYYKYEKKYREIICSNKTIFKGEILKFKAPKKSSAKIFAWFLLIKSPIILILYIDLSSDRKHDFGVKLTLILENLRRIE